MTKFSDWANKTKTRMFLFILFETSQEKNVRLVSTSALVHLAHDVLETLPGQKKNASRSTTVKKAVEVKHGRTQG